MNILLLEDDAILSSTIINLLSLEQYNITHATNGSEVLDFTFNNSYDLYLFDINVPLINGIDLLNDLRNAGDTTPTFFISALIDIDSISKAFDSGCDDYIKKPFEFDELLIRIKSILKRSYGSLKYNDIKYDTNTKQVTKNNIVIKLGSIETAIFELFIKNISSIVSKDSIYEQMDNPTSVALRVHISRLKKLLDLNIVNIRGIGYRLEEL